MKFSPEMPEFFTESYVFSGACVIIINAAVICCKLTGRKEGLNLYSRNEDFYDGEGCLRKPGESFYDGEGILREPGEEYFDYQGYLRSPNDSFYDSQGFIRNSGECFFDSKDILREG